MKKYLLLVCLFIIITKVNAQWFGVPYLTTFDDRRVHFGFTLGINSFDLKFSHYNTIYNNQLFSTEGVAAKYLSEIDSVGGMIRADIASLSPGFTVGIVSNLRLTENLDLRFIPGLSFGNRRIVYNVPIHDINKFGDIEEYPLRSIYLDFPLLVKYKSKRIINQRPYMIGGLALRYDMTKSVNEELLRLNKWTLFAEAGMGWDVYLQFFRLSTELKYSFGLFNQLTEPPIYPQLQYYNLSFKKLNAHILTLSFHFE